MFLCCYQHEHASLPTSLVARSSRRKHQSSSEAKIDATSAVSLWRQTMFSTWEKLHACQVLNAYKNETVNHLVHHVPCNTMTIQRIHYWPVGSLLWFILRMISIAKTLHNHIFNAEAGPSRLSNMLPLLLQGGQCTEAWWCQVCWLLL